MGGGREAMETKRVKYSGDKVLCLNKLCYFMVNFSKTEFVSNALCTVRCVV